MEYLEINGWKIYFHACFTAQLMQLVAEVATLKASQPEEYRKKKPTKLLAAITRVVREVIAADPLGPQFRHGGTLGDEHKHWFRAKFLQQFRLFYRCSEQHKTVILGWVNDEHSLRAYDSKTDAYKIFAKMLAAGHPPDDWDALLQEARTHMPSLQIELLSGVR